MQKKLVASLVVIITITASLGLFFISLSQFQTTPEVSVNGGFITAQSESSVTVRALTPEIIVTLNWENGTGPNPFRITTNNMNPAKLNIESVVPFSIIETENASITVEIIPTMPKFNITFSTQEPTNEFEFYVFGDSQGYQEGIKEIAKNALIDNPDFVFHCGDLTPFGQQNQYEAVSNALAFFHVPVFTTIGNHDTRLGGSSLYLDYFGPSTYSFNYGPAHFIIFNSSSGDVSESELRWLESDLSHSTLKWNFVFTHIPLFDPRPAQNHTLLNSTTTARLITLFKSTNVDAVFAGHIHMFNHSVIDGIDYVITGGAGASLYASSDSGGFYHYVHVQVHPTSLTITPVSLPEPTIARDMVVIRGISEDVTLTIDDLKQLTLIEGSSSFQNSYGNWRGQGTYIGVKLSDLLSFVGGMEPSNILRIVSYDGYQQEFAYSNVHPNESWNTIQGDMILAFSYNGTTTPDWDQGLRIVMIPIDGGYSNEDCSLTSETGMGYHVYPSAGARWVSNVEFIEVVEV